MSERGKLELRHKVHVTLFEEMSIREKLIVIEKVAPNIERVELVLEGVKSPLLNELDRMPNVAIGLMKTEKI